MWLLNADICGRKCSKTVTSDSRNARSFALCEKKHGRIYSNGSTSLKNPLLVGNFECEHEFILSQRSNLKKIMSIRL